MKANVPAGKSSRPLLSLARAGCLPIIILCVSISCFAEENGAGPSFLSPRDIEVAEGLRVEVLEVDRGAELLTFFYGSIDPGKDGPVETPVFSVLRDTLDSSNRDVHLLRYVWIHTYAQPSIRQRLAASIPFFYSRFGNARVSKNRTPSPVIDFGASHIPERLSLLALKTFAVDPRFAMFEALLRTYGKNHSNYRQAQLRRVSLVLSQEDLHPDAPVFSQGERLQLQRRLIETEKPLGSLLSDGRLEDFYRKQTMAMRQACAKNWELLRQRAEAEGLYFEPLLLPDGTATHALLFVAREDLQKNRSRRFDSRFLSIGSPWGDESLLKWTGATEMRSNLDLIPLALYGLEHPKMPTLLIDFRKSLNPKRRELSREMRQQLESRFTFGTPGLMKFATTVGKSAYGFITHRRGADLFQQSRANSYSQLKMLLSTNDSIGKPLLFDIGKRLEYVATNPIENDFHLEIELARTQYTALLAYARRPGGLQADLLRDRRAEMVGASHSAAARKLFRIARLSSLGIYTHREHDRPETVSTLQARRIQSNDLKFIRDVLKSDSPIEISWDVKKVQATLHRLAGSSAITGEKLAGVAGQIFWNTADQGTRESCLKVLSGLTTRRSRIELTRIAEDRNLSGYLRTLSADYLNGLNQLQIAGNAAGLSKSDGSNDEE